MSEAAHHENFNRLSSLVAMYGIGECGACIALIMPGIVNALTLSRALSVHQAAVIASSESLGICTATFLVSFLIGTIDRRLIGVFAIVLASGADILTGFATTYPALVALRFIAGSGEGLCIAVMVASFAGIRLPERAIAFEVIMNTAIATVVLMAIRGLTADGRSDVIFFFIGGVTIAASAFLFVLPPRPPLPIRPNGPLGLADGDRESNTLTGLFGLAAVFCLYASIGIVWPLVGQTGLQAGLSNNYVVAALANSAVFGVVAGVVICVVGARFGRRLPILIGLGGLGTIMALLVFGQVDAIFAAATGGFIFFWMLSGVYLSALLAVIDRRGRVVTTALPLQFFGLTIGPLVASELGQARSLYCGILLTVAAALLVLLAIRNQLAALSRAALIPMASTAPPDSSL